MSLPTFPAICLSFELWLKLGMNVLSTFLQTEVWGLGVQHRWCQVQLLLENQGFAFSSKIQLNIPIPGFTMPRSGTPSSFMRISPQIRQEPQKMEGPKDFSYFCRDLGGIEGLSLGEVSINRTFCPSAYSLHLFPSISRVLMSIFKILLTNPFPSLMLLGGGAYQEHPFPFLTITLENYSMKYPSLHLVAADSLLIFIILLFHQVLGNKFPLVWLHFIIFTTKYVSFFPTTA